MPITYAHQRLDTGQIFYIGKGSLRRAHEQRGHNRYWNAVVAKHGYSVVELAQWGTDVDAFAHERFLIARFRDLGHPLTNATDGGEGLSGWKWSPSQREKLLKSLTGRVGTFTGRTHTANTRHLMSLAKKGTSGPRLGVTVSADTRAKMRDSANAQWLSDSNRQRQRDLSRSQMRQIAAAGQIFESVHAFALAVKRPLSTVHRWVKRGWQDKMDAAVLAQGGL